MVPGLSLLTPSPGSNSIARCARSGRRRPWRRRRSRWRSARSCGPRSKSRGQWGGGSHGAGICREISEEVKHLGGASESWVFCRETVSLWFHFEFQPRLISHFQKLPVVSRQPWSLPHLLRSCPPLCSRGAVSSPWRARSGRRRCRRPNEIRSLSGFLFLFFEAQCPPGNRSRSGGSVFEKCSLQGRCL